MTDPKFRYRVRYKNDPPHPATDAYFAMFTNSLDLEYYWNSLPQHERDRLTVDYYHQDGTVWTRDRREQLQ